MPEVDNTAIIDMIKELQLDPSRQVELIQKLENEGLTEDLKKELLEEVKYMETSLSQEDELVALAQRAYQNPKSIPSLMEEVSNKTASKADQIESDLTNIETGLIAELEKEEV